MRIDIYPNLVIYEYIKNLKGLGSFIALLFENGNWFEIEIDFETSNSYRLYGHGIKLNAPSNMIVNFIQKILVPLYGGYIPQISIYGEQRL